MAKTKVEKVAVYQNVILSEENRCDRCGRHLWFHTRYGYKKPGQKNMVDYYNIVTGHYNWGNDSIDSVKTYV